MKKPKTRTCPSCKQKYNDPPAISRADDYTLICPECGTQEAIAVFVTARQKEAKS